MGLVYIYIHAVEVIVLSDVRLLDKFVMPK